LSPQDIVHLKDQMEPPPDRRRGWKLRLRARSLQTCSNSHSIPTAADASGA
jgi:hypothetical protein